MRPFSLALALFVACLSFSTGVAAADGDTSTWPLPRLERAAKNGDVNAINRLAWRLFYGDGAEENPARAIELWMPLAEKQNEIALYYLGIAHAEGQGVEQDFVKALKYFKQGAKLGDLDCVYEVGYAYCAGQGVEKNEEAAVRCYKLAAEKGHADSMAELGNHYEEGEGVEQSYAEALRWYKTAAEEEQPWAIYCLGWLYLEGNGVKKDVAAANKLFQRGARLEQRDCMYMLGVAYYNGEQGVPKNWQTSFRWALKSAEAGCPEGMVLVGELYRDGEGVKRNKDEARKWFKQAIELGDANAPAALQKLEANPL